MLQLAHGLGFDLADALARNLENPADLFERVGIAVSQAVTQADDFALSVSKGLEQALDFVLEHGLRGRGYRAERAFILDEFTEAAILALTHRAVETHRMPPDIQNAARLFNADVGCPRRFFRCGLAAEFLK